MEKDNPVVNSAPADKSLTTIPYGSRAKWLETAAALYGRRYGLLCVAIRSRING